MPDEPGYGLVIDTIWTRCLCKPLKCIETQRVPIPPSPPIYTIRTVRWRMTARDRFIGWDESVRQQNLSLIANNMRFLILPWVRVTHLASHLLALSRRQIGADCTVRMPDMGSIRCQPVVSSAGVSRGCGHGAYMTRDRRPWQGPYYHEFTLAPGHRLH